MKCSDIQELFGVYWDLPNDNLRRVAVDKHIENCESCLEEFQIWEESTILIRSAADGKCESGSPHPVSEKVMTRIYQDESWRIPIPERLYAISYNIRRNVTMAIVCSLALFIFSFLFSLMNDHASDTTTVSASSSLYDLQAPKALDGNEPESMNGHSMGSAVASLNSGFMDPLQFNVDPIHSYPHYLLVISLLGLIITILIMNWFSRTKA
jgi:hypothetical protein